jgi:hypothetical protein
MTSQTSSTLPAPAYSGNTTSSQAKGAPACADEMVDIIHLTGGGNQFYVLNEKEAKELKQEIKIIQKLMDEFHQIVSQSTGEPCKRDSITSCTCSYCKKDEWALKAHEAGIFEYTPVPFKKEEKALTTDEDIEDKKNKLLKARDFYENYNHWSALANGQIANALSHNWQLLKTKKLAEIDGELARLGAKAPGPKEEKKSDKAVQTMANDAKPTEQRAWGGVSKTNTHGKSKIRGLHEIVAFSEPNRRFYISRNFSGGRKWMEVKSDVLSRKGASVKDFINDIRSQIREEANTRALAKLEFKYKVWESKEDNLLNSLHRQLFKYEPDSDTTSPYAISAEAHVLRFAAGASAGGTSFNLKSGNIDLGAKFEAAFSLAEGKISLLETYLPKKEGREVFVSYKNSLGKESRHSFGFFRLKGGVEFSCFAGLKGKIEGTAKGNVPLKKKQPTGEVSSGVYAALGRPHLDFKSGECAITAEAFFGAQAGGKISGCVEWLAPLKSQVPAPGKDSLSSSKEPPPNWEALAEVKLEGNAAVGIGANADFKITLDQTSFVIYTKAMVVFGPGAGGAFGIEVSIEQVAAFIYSVCSTLQNIDYRYLLSMDDSAFIFMSRILYKIAAYPKSTVDTIVKDGYSALTTWWEDREKSFEEAENIATTILSKNAVSVNGIDIPISKLPPETIGPMLWQLSETFIEKFSVKREHAIIKILENITKWRQFIEVLEHMELYGNKKTSAMANLNRLNSFLLASQKNQFNIYIESLTLNNYQENSGTVIPWTPGNGIQYAQQKEQLLATIRETSNRYLA